MGIFSKLKNWWNQTDKEPYWGYHLLLDMQGCNDSINDVEAVRQFLKELVPAIKMVPFGEPQVFYFNDCNGAGVTGVQIITTSTITFHGDADGMCVYLDVFSCAPFEENT